MRLNLTTCVHEGLRKDLRKGVIDLAFLLAESIEAADIEVEVLGFESIVPVASPHHGLAKKKVVVTRDLQGETVLLSRVDCSYRRTFERTLEDEGVSSGATFIFHSVEALKRCVMEGIGVTILPEVSVAREIERGELARLAWAEGAFEVALLMIRSRARWISPTLSAFLETTREVLKEKPD